jgi:hypothetical protein
MSLRHRIALAAVTGLAVLSGLASAATAADWHSEQPLTPGSDVPVALGRVYDIQFWSPNRGALITKDGLWAYDGTGWHPLSTVCGGTNGRIAWAGPLDLWTISDQPIGQSNPGNVDLTARSLCHIVNGTVVGSYAQPIGGRGSYLRMHGAACLSAADCWFGGDRLPGTVNTGAFHLHWDGHAMTPWPSLTARDPSLADPARTVTDLAAFQGRLYEAVQVQADDVVPGEASDQPFVLHEVVTGEPPAFTPQFTDQPMDYGQKAPSLLAGFQLSGDGDALWAAAGPRDISNKPAPTQVLRLDRDGLRSVPLTDPQNLLKAGVGVNDLAAEPGADSAWIAYTPPSDDGSGIYPARLARVHGDGDVDDATTLPSPADGIARKGSADRIACPAPGQCWMATTTGWLFHLGDGLPRDDAPAMHRLITYRPPDASTPVFSPDTLPDDDSGIAPPVIPQPPPIGYTPPADDGPKKKAKKLVTGASTRLIRGTTTIEYRFTLTAKARVQLVAKRKKQVVAKTKRRTLAKGKHKLRLKLSRKRWPTALNLNATAVKTTSDAEGDDPSSAQAGDGADNAEADDHPDAGPVTIASVPRTARR